MSASASLPMQRQLQDFVMRDARKDDLDDVTRIHVEGFEVEPLDNYCYPLRDEFPEDYWKWTKKDYENYLDQPHKYKVHVLEGAHNNDAGDKVKLMGLAVWDISVTTERSGAGTRTFALKLTSGCS